MTKKITIEVPETWADVIPGTAAADQVVMGLKDLVREQLPSKYERWKTAIGSMRNVGYMEDQHRKLAQGAVAAIDAMVQARRVLAGVVDEEFEAAVRRIDGTLYECMPRDIVDEIRSWHPIRGQITTTAD